MFSVLSSSSSISFFVCRTSRFLRMLRHPFHCLLYRAPFFPTCVSPPASRSSTIILSSLSLQGCYSAARRVRNTQSNRWLADFSDCYEHQKASIFTYDTFLPLHPVLSPLFPSTSCPKHLVPELFSNLILNDHLQSFLLALKPVIKRFQYLPSQTLLTVQVHLRQPPSRTLCCTARPHFEPQYNLSGVMVQLQCLILISSRNQSGNPHLYTKKLWRHNMQ